MQKDTQSLVMILAIAVKIDTAERSPRSKSLQQAPLLVYAVTMQENDSEGWYHDIVDATAHPRSQATDEKRTRKAMQKSNRSFACPSAERRLQTREAASDDQYRKT